MRPCFTFKAKAGDKPAVLAIDEEIGFWGTQAKDFRAQLDSVEAGDLEVEINSPGGEVMAGLGMYNMLRNWASASEGRTVTTRVTGIAASIASIIALAGDKRVMPKNAFAMVHQASGMAWGTSDELRETAQVLDKINGSMRGIYVDRMGVDEAKATEIMAKDTWLTAEECLELGFVTELSDAVQATAKFDTAKAELPDHVAAVFKAEDKTPEPEPKPEPVVEPVVPDTPLTEQIVEASAKANLSEFAAHFAVSCDTMVAATARIKTALDITALCAVVKRPEIALSAIKANKSVADVRAELVDVLAKEDEQKPTNPTQKQPDANRAGSGVSPEAIWNSRNARKASQARKETAK